MFFFKSVTSLSKLIEIKTHTWTGTYVGITARKILVTKNDTYFPFDKRLNAIAVPITSCNNN